jgi:NAD+ synthase
LEKGEILENVQVSSPLAIDVAAEVDRICLGIKRAVFGELRRKGVVVGVSGGIDSSVVAALAVRALGTERVLALFTPEIESSDESLPLGRMVAGWLGISSTIEDIAPILEAVGCYRRRSEAIRSVVPEFGDGWRCKLVLPNLLDSDVYPVFSIVVESPQGEMKKVRLPLNEYLGIVAATSFKQRTRKMMEYYHADLRRFAVAGTPNRLEYDQGFFVKNGDGAADLKPIAHLYKTQVYDLARYLGVPEEIQRRPPTTDTYSLPQSQEEFYFSLPLDKMDLCLYGKDHGSSPEEIGRMIGMRADQVRRVYGMIDAKRKVAQYLHMSPIVFASVD